MTPSYSTTPILPMLTRNQLGSIPVAEYSKENAGEHLLPGLPSFLARVLPGHGRLCQEGNGGRVCGGAREQRPIVECSGRQWDTHQWYGGITARREGLPNGILEPKDSPRAPAKTAAGGGLGAHP